MVSGCSTLSNFGSQNNEASGPVQTDQPPQRVYSSRTAPAKMTSSDSYVSHYDGPRDASILADNYPNNYTVVRGDTLWDISARFLRDPWLWPEVWQVNEQIVNPHLIYPGDIISLVWVDGKPQLRLGDGSVRLSPKVRYEDLGQAIPTIPYSDIAGFLAKPTVLDRTYADSLPYILASADGRLIMSEGNLVYARANLHDLAQEQSYSIMNIGEPYYDPETKFIYGYEATNVGEGKVTTSGDPVSMRLIDTNREVLRGDRLMPLDIGDNSITYYPHTAVADLNGSIISVVDGVKYVGQYDIVVLNRGADAGIEDGSVIAIYQRGDSVYDPYAIQQIEQEESGLINKIKDMVKPDVGNIVKLPDEPAGTAMVFRTFNNISYAIVMHAEREIHEGDSIRSPQ
jgi:LysM repeat protein